MVGKILTRNIGGITGYEQTMKIRGGTGRYAGGGELYFVVPKSG